MAKCDLSIELDHPDALHEGGGTVSGVVRVVADADVNCSGLEVQSGWRTHGRGNVASGTAGATTLFSGQWKAGETSEYRFELPIAHWPPSYHGHYLNVDHYVDARAKIPWGFDPKASVPFMMRPTVEGGTAKLAKEVTEMKGVVGAVIGLITFAFLIAFVVGLAVAGPFSLIFLLFPLIGFVYWFVRKFLPRWILGEVVGTFPVEAISPGGSVQGELTIEPKKGVSINGITLLFQAREQCVSGSGSNRTTHQHPFFEQTEVLQEATTLAPGVQHRFPIALKLPGDAPYSLDLDDNKLIWSATLRVDIPRWPDWVSEFPLTVAPNAQSTSQRATSQQPTSQQAPAALRGVSVGAPRREVDDWAAPADPGALNVGSIPVGPIPDESNEAEEGVTFAETASHLWSLRDQRDQVEILVDAVMNLTFDLEVIVERRLLYSGDDDPHVYKDGHAVWAHFTEPPLPMVLYVPHDLADEFEQIGRDVWRGRGTIVGWDHRHGRLQVKLERGGHGSQRAPSGLNSRQ